jgi:hypothetical protein
MNRNQLIWEIQRLTADWHIDTWKHFRSLNDYWTIRDRARKNDGYFNEARYVKFLVWKLDKIKKY